MYASKHISIKKKQANKIELLLIVIGPHQAQNEAVVLVLGT